MVSPLENMYTRSILSPYMYVCCRCEKEISPLQTHEKKSKNQNAVKEYLESRQLDFNTVKSLIEGCQRKRVIGGYQQQ